MTSVPSKMRMRKTACVGPSGMGKVKGRKARTCRRTHGSSQNIAEDETGKSKDITEVDFDECDVFACPQLTIWLAPY